jgi:hypothetical protein
VALQLAPELPFERQPAVPGFGDESLEVLDCVGGGEIEDGSRRAGERQTVAMADVAAIDTCAVDSDVVSGGGPVGGDSDVDRVGRVGHQLP